MKYVEGGDGVTGGGVGGAAEGGVCEKSNESDATNGRPNLSSDRKQIGV